MKMTVVWVLVCAGLLLAGYIRLAPSDPSRWHVAPVGETSRDMMGAVVRVVETGPDGLARLDVVARQSPRTSVLAGSVDEGMVTYITRTRLMGFPDYTTAQQDGDALRIHARLRFGRKDFGVNKARVESWLGQLQ
ncbi:DUF1499 domain-containing protein [Ruegeria arenilitoris]|uniref:DUF1499 domain-containing protein n=1 Tax=Ruegeria arenilitoris TaxID=1173585 RepID=UPI0014813A72|nr:DUF1499 domain-containing protein [Ruegeria arenilitoris]